MSETPRGPLFDTTIWIGSGSYGVFDLLAHQQYRSGLSVQDQLGIATAAAKIEDKEARELVLKVLGNVQYLNDQIENMKDVFKKLSEGLKRLDDELAKAKKT